MKNVYTQNAGAFIIFCTIFFFSYNVSAQVGINTIDPHPSSMLEIKSDDKGILIPRISKNDREAMADPAYGLMVFDTDSQSFWYFKQGFSTAPYIDRWEEVGKNSLKTIVHYQDPNGLTLFSSITGFSGYRMLKFPTKIIDRNDEFDPDNSTFTAKKDGIYNIYAQVTYKRKTSGSTGPYHVLSIFKTLAIETTIPLAENFNIPPVSDSNRVSLTTQILAELKAGDKIFFGLFENNSVDPISLPRGSQTQFTIHQIE